MGMFDSLYDADNNEWQTKALACVLAQYEIGDEVPGPPIDHQMEVLGGERQSFDWSFATVRGGRLVALPTERDPKLALRLYSSGWQPATEGE